MILVKALVRLLEIPNKSAMIHFSVNDRDGQ